MKKFVEKTVKETKGSFISGNNHIACGLMTYMEADTFIFGIHIPHVLKKLVSITDNSDTVLDYANKFEELTEIKTVSYLRLYRDYFGQIE